MQWQIAAPITGLLVVYAYLGKKLTLSGIAAAIGTAAVSAYHPWNLPFALLCVFFLTGTLATKVKHGYKKTLTMSATGAGGGEGPRTHTQVFANSLIATALTWMHAQQLRSREAVLLSDTPEGVKGSLCLSWQGDILPVGIIACYAAAAADTLGSELGILARSEPRLITDPWRKVPRGTNGGVTIEGLIAGLLGSTIIAFTSVYLLPFCGDKSEGALGGGAPWSEDNKKYFIVAIALWGVLGSIIDSWLGANFQRTVRDARSGKIIEGDGGVRVMTTADQEERVKRDAKLERARRRNMARARGEMAPTEEEVEKIEAEFEEKAKAAPKSEPSRVAEAGTDFLDNNDVNFAMSFFVGVTAMAVACRVWGTTFDNLKVV